MEAGEGTVRVGSSVEVRDGDVTERWRIVPDFEADALQHAISDGSPLATALLGHGMGDVVRVRVPGHGSYPVRILSVD
jgi:transcription elongation GreA/GreB family factor